MKKKQLAFLFKSKCKFCNKVAENTGFTIKVSEHPDFKKELFEKNFFRENFESFLPDSLRKDYNFKISFHNDIVESKVNNRFYKNKNTSVKLIIYCPCYSTKWEYLIKFS